jgi:hypothetical protein
MGGMDMAGSRMIPVGQSLMMPARPPGSYDRIVGRKIVGFAETGERDHTRLRDRALEELRGNAGPSSPVATFHGLTVEGEVKPVGAEALARFK